MQKVSTFRVRGKVSAPFIWMQFDLSSEGKPEKKVLQWEEETKTILYAHCGQTFFWCQKSGLFSTFGTIIEGLPWCEGLLG